MDIPMGYEKESRTNMVCQIKKSLWSQAISLDMISKIYESYGEERLLSRPR